MTKKIHRLKRLLAIVAFGTLRGGNRIKSTPTIYKRSHIFGWAIVLMTVLGLGTNAYGQELVRLSLNPFGASLESGHP